MIKTEGFTTPFKPDIVFAYKFKECSLCKHRKEVDPSYDNFDCTSCDKKVFSWKLPSKES